MSRPAEADFARYRATGDAGALAAVFDQAAPKLLLLASHWTRDPATAEDLVQVTFVQAVRDAAQWDAGQPLFAWLAGILAHRALDLRKHAARQHEPLPEELPGREPNPLAAAMDQETLARITAAIDDLPEPYRSVLVLRLVHGLEPVAIAHALGRQPATVRKQLERGLQQLRGALPAAIAVLLSGLLTSGRGLAAVRESLLHPGVPALPAVITTLGGVLLMKKALVSLAGALALAGLLFWSLSRDAAPAVVQPPPPEPVAMASSSPPASTGAGTAEPSRVPAEVAATDPCSAVLEILVLDEASGAPVPGIDVRLIPRNGLDQDLQTRGLATDAAGRATFERLAAGQHHVAVARTHAQLDESKRELTAELVPGERRRLEVRVPGMAILSGRVVDARGQPVPGASVLRRQVTHLGPVGDEDMVAASSGPDGSFRVAVLVGTVTLQAREESHAPSPVLSFPGDEPPDSLVLQLGDQPARLTGTVTRAGEKVAAASLTLERSRPVWVREGRVQSNEHANSTAHSDAEGRFELGGLLPGKVLLRVRASGAAPKAVDVQLEPGKTTELVITMDPAACVRGRVLDQDGAPLATVLIWCQQRQTRTTRAGEFLFDCLAPGRVDVRAGPLDGYCARQQQLEVPVGLPVECELRLERLPLLSGRVVDSAGHALRGMVVTARRSDMPRGTGRPMTDDQGRLDILGTRTATSGVGGEFTLPLMPGTAYLLDVSEKDQWFASYGERLGTFTAPRDDVVLTVPPEELATAFVIGRLLDGEGKPLTRVWFQVADGKRIGTIGSNTPGTRHPDQGGRFRIGPLPARGYVLRVQPDDAAVPRFETPRFQLQPGQTLDLGDVTSGAFGTLCVKLRREGGGVFPEALLQLESEHAPDDVLQFPASGDLERSIKPGSYTMTIYGGPFPSWKQSITVAAGERKSLEFTRRAGIRFFVRLLPPGVERGTVVVRSAEGEVEFTGELTSIASGGSSPSLTPGMHHVELSCPDGSRYTASFDVREQSGEPGKNPVPFEPAWTRAK